MVISTFPESFITVVNIVIFFIVLLVVLYVLLYIFSHMRKHTRKKRSKDWCHVCGHKVKFMSECHRAHVKYKGKTSICTTCKKICDVVCGGCGHTACKVNCDKCIRKVD